MIDVKKLGELMWREDAASRSLGMKLEEIRLGFARLSMRVTKNMVASEIERKSATVKGDWV